MRFSVKISQLNSITKFIHRCTSLLFSFGIYQFNILYVVISMFSFSSIYIFILKSMDDFHLCFFPFFSLHDVYFCSLILQIFGAKRHKTSKRANQQLYIWNTEINKKETTKSGPSIRSQNTFWHNQWYIRFNSDERKQSTAGKMTHCANSCYFLFFCYLFFKNIICFLYYFGYWTE